MFYSSKENSLSAESLAERLNKGISAAADFLRTAEAAVITLGTAYVYRNTDGNIVNNCHKLPSRQFRREKLDPVSAAKALKEVVQELKKINSELKIIFTLSPVRHLRDDASENSLSKAILRCAVDDVCSGPYSSSLWYYPSYEIMLDELRDYRWYAEDLCHPDSEAVEYIISRFIANIYKKEFTDFLEDWMKIIRDLNHKPFNPESEDYKNFLKNALSRKKHLSDSFPDYLDKD